MKPHIKKAWLKALRSGEYVQGYKRLLTIEDNGEHSFCCLGVLCDLNSRATGTKWTIEHHSIMIGDYCGSTTNLSDEVLQWSGISFKNDFRDLIKMNDVDNKSFKQIANYIEKEL